jgi:hypothetical protein
VSAVIVRVEPPLRQFNLRHLHRGALDHLAHFGFGEVSSSAGAHIRQPIPFVHPEVADSDLDIKSTVVLSRNASFLQLIVEHVDMCILATFDFGDQTSPGFCKGPNTASDKALPPFMLCVVGPTRSLASSDTDEDANISSWPFIHRGLFKYLRARIVLSSSVIVKYTLTNLDGLESKAGGARSTPRLPDRAIKFWGRFLA